MNSGSREAHLECVKFILNNWIDFQECVGQRCGGKDTLEKAAWLPTAICEWIWDSKNCDAETIELEGIIDSIMYDVFNLSIENDSVLEVSNKIVEARNLCLQGRVNEAMQKYCILNAPMNRNITRRDDDDDSSSDDDDEVEMMEQDPPQLVPATDKNKEKEPKIDEDGWETVQSRRYKK